MSIFDYFPKIRQKTKSTGLSDFLLHASDKQKEKVFREAARRANEDQRKLIESLKKNAH